MWHNENREADDRFCIGLRGLLAGLLGLTMVGAAVAGPLDRDFSLTRSTDHAQFRVSVESNVLPIPMGRIHSWRVHLTDPDGAPVRQAVMNVSGGMPQHGHGLPTQPRVVEADTPGDYLINGVRFSMTGWWVLNLAIRTPDGRADTVTFNLTL